MELLAGEDFYVQTKQGLLHFRLALDGILGFRVREDTPSCHQPASGLPSAAGAEARDALEREPVVFDVDICLDGLTGRDSGGSKPHLCGTRAVSRL